MNNNFAKLYMIGLLSSILRQVILETDTCSIDNRAFLNCVLSWFQFRKSYLALMSGRVFDDTFLLYQALTVCGI